MFGELRSKKRKRYLSLALNKRPILVTKTVPLISYLPDGTTYHKSSSSALIAKEPQT